MRPTRPSRYDASFALWNVVGLLTIITTLFFASLTVICTYGPPLEVFTAYLLVLVGPPVAALALVHAGCRRLAAGCALIGAGTSASCLLGVAYLFLIQAQPFGSFAGLFFCGGALTAFGLPLLHSALAQARAGTVLRGETGRAAHLPAYGRRHAASLPIHGNER